MTRLSTLELAAALRKAGCSEARRTGSHAIWKTPAGRNIVFPANHKGRPVSPRIVKQAADALRAEGLALGA